MGQTSIRGVVYPPSEISNLDFDLVIISISEYAEEIRTNLINKYGVKEQQIVVFQGTDKGIKFEDERIAMLRKCIAILKERNVKGNMAEVGVYTGEFSKLFNRYFPDKKLYLFDTFEGFDSADITTEQKNGFSAAQAGEFSETTVELVMGRMPHPEKCIPRKGWFPDSAAGISEQFALVRLDVDLYEPTLAGLRWFGERLSSGGCLIVDDYFNESYAGVRAAVDEYCITYSEKKLLPFGVGFTAVLI